jgi:hypothetical protein
VITSEKSSRIRGHSLFSFVGRSIKSTTSWNPAEQSLQTCRIVIGEEVCSDQSDFQHREIPCHQARAAEVISESSWASNCKIDISQGAPISCAVCWSDAICFSAILLVCRHRAFTVRDCVPFTVSSMIRAVRSPTVLTSCKLREMN